jgi:hypothetical protein
LLANSLSLEPHRFDSAYADRDVDSLLSDARRWITGADAHSRTPEAGCLIEFAVLLARHEPAVARASIETRVKASAARELVTVIDDIELPDDADEADRVGMALHTLLQRVSGRTHDVLELASACWDGSREPAKARDRLLQLNAVLAEVPYGDLLALDVRHSLAYWTGQAGDPTAARDQYAALLPDQVRIAGPDSTIALRTYAEVLRWTSRAGQPAQAVQCLIALSRSDQVVADTAMRTTVEDALGEALLTFLDRASRDQADPIDEQLPAATFLGDLRAAVTGDLEALARTPAELVSIITEIRGRRSGPATEPPLPARDDSS